MIDFTFQFQDGETPGQRFVRLFKELLAAGDLTDTKRSDVLRSFLACGHHPALSNGADNIETVHTNCAMTQGAALHWCGGNNRPGPGHSGWPMLGAPGSSWLGLQSSGPAWVKYDGTNTPDSLPVIFFVQSASNPNNCHVGALLEPRDDGSFTSAEGGGGNGSLVHFSWRAIGPKFDGMGRKLRGWWVVDLLGLPDEKPTDPAPPPSAPFIPLFHGQHGDRVKLWQLMLHSAGYQLPRSFKTGHPDGGFGDETEQATRNFQHAHGLTATGIVDQTTWNVAGGRQQ